MTVSNLSSQTKVYRVRPKDFVPQIEVAACYVRVGEKYLLLHRSKGKPQEFTWGVPAGKLEKGETSGQAVIREVEEETGISLDRDSLRAARTLFIRYPDFDFVYHMFGQELPEQPTVCLSDEHQDYSWLPIDEVLSLPLMAGAGEALQEFLHSPLVELPKLPR
jgi:8-oxo-dGTP pyrophosphatase MutT (NUDIX family)